MPMRCCVQILELPKLLNVVKCTCVSANKLSATSHCLKAPFNLCRSIEPPPEVTGHLTSICRAAMCFRKLRLTLAFGGVRRSLHQHTETSSLHEGV